MTPTLPSIHRLADGTSVRLRRLQPDDRDWLLALGDHLSAESVYRRFFSPLPRLPENILQRLLSVDGCNHVAIAAETVTDGSSEPEPLGVARFIRIDGMPDMAEAAITVADHMQRRGLGALLVRTMAAVAREIRISRFRMEILTSNAPMNALVRALDPGARPIVIDAGVVTYELRISALRGLDQNIAARTPISSR